MKKLLTILYSITLLVACNSSEDPIIPSPDSGDGVVEISFMPEVSEVQNQSRSTEPLAQDFKLYGYKTTPQGTLYEIFNGLRVEHSYDTENDQHTYNYLLDGEVPRYWDVNAGSYRFWGFVYASNCTYTPGSLAGPATLTINASSIDQLFDVYFSHMYLRERNDGDTIPTDDVTLQFVRPFCNVRVAYLDANGDPIDEVDEEDRPYASTYSFGPVVGYVATAGIVKATFRKDAATEEVEVTYTDRTKNVELPDQEFHAQFPMGKQSDFKLEAVIDGEHLQVTIPAAHMTWNPNCNYTYLIKMTGSRELVLFDVQVEEWSSGGTFQGTITQW